MFPWKPFSKAQDLTGRQIKMDALDKQAKELQIAGDRRSAG